MEIGAVMKKLLLAILVIVVLIALWLYWRMDGFKSIAPHFAGSCKTINGLASAEDFQIDHQAEVAFISAMDRLAVVRGENIGNGTIAVYDLVAAANKFLLPTLEAPDDFSPHGLSLYQAADGQRSLYVINHRASGEETIEVFDINPEHQLQHRKTLRHSLFVSPNDLVVVGPEQFYLANDSGASNGVETVLEMLGLMQFAKIVYFNRGDASVVIDNFPAAGGINATADAKTLYIGASSTKSLEIYQRDLLSGALSFSQSIPLAMAVDNIDVAADGAVWVAGHPNLIDLIRHFSSAGDKPAPSQVTVIPYDSYDGRLVEPVDLFTSLGLDLSASSVAAEHKGRFYIGGITARKILVCTPG
jgi:arylesterase/paraoxonase